MKEHPFRLDPWLPPDHKDQGRCMCGLPKASRFHVEPPPKPEEDRSAEILGERGEVTEDTAFRAKEPPDLNGSLRI